MAIDYEALAKMLPANRQGGKKAGDLEAYKGLLDTPEAKTLRAQLSDGKGDALEQAADAAARGDTEALRKLMSRVMETREGAALVKQAMNIYRGKK
ncbi:MAG: hypothetical protein LBT60_02190 [Oscillospiraceae bacterium]|jgi:hypothetical protein|nr:hypothetical protein [Oscillospiraceae bacterium]